MPRIKGTYYYVYQQFKKLGTFIEAKVLTEADAEALDKDISKLFKDQKTINRKQDIDYSKYEYMEESKQRDAKTDTKDGEQNTETSTRKTKG